MTTLEPMRRCPTCGAPASEIQRRTAPDGRGYLWCGWCGWVAREIPVEEALRDE